jgi:hypothetical protein
MPPQNENGSHSHSRRAAALTTASGVLTFASEKVGGVGCERVFGGGMVTLREANKCSCAVIYQQLGICRGARPPYNDIGVLYACTFVAGKLARDLVLISVGGCVGLVVVSVGKCYTTAHI